VQGYGFGGKGCLCFLKIKFLQKRRILRQIREWIILLRYLSDLLIHVAPIYNLEFSRL